MKVEIEKEEKGFKPFKLTLTVESEDELKYLWHHFNMTFSQIKQSFDNRCMDVPVSINYRLAIFDAINNKAVELGLRK